MSRYMSRLVPALVLTLIVAAGCSRRQNGMTPIAPTTPPPTAPSASICAPALSTPGGPITDPNGPYAHRVAVGRLGPGARVVDARHVLDHASVPDGARGPDGRLLVYYVNGEDGGVWVASVSGASAQPLGAISINGVTRPNGVVDPDAFVVAGRIRLAYLAGFGPPSSGAARAMCLAESSDGINFTVLGVALTIGSEMWTDPSVGQLRDGRWLMAISAGNQTVLARSSDGLSFVAGERLTYGGVPEVAILDDGRVRLYVCAQGIQSYVSSDTSTWTFEATVVPGPGLLCDPSHVAGTDLFVYKTGY